MSEPISTATLRATANTHRQGLPIRADLIDAAADEIDRLRAALDQPDPTAFMAAADIEARYQMTHWNDAHKTDADWFWLVGHLAGKALHIGEAEGRTKLLHRVTTVAAAAANWHRSIAARPASGSGEQ